MERKDLVSLCGNLSVACMVMAANLERIQGDLALAMQDALASCERTQSAIQTVLLVQDGELPK